MPRRVSAPGVYSPPNEGFPRFKRTVSAGLDKSDVAVGRGDRCCHARRRAGRLQDGLVKMVAAELAGRVENVPDPSTLMYEDYVNLPDDGRRYEILDGELAVSPSPTSRHQLVSHNLDFALSSWVRAKGPGRTWPAPLALILAATVVMQADLIFVSKSRSAIVTTRGLVAVPDLVIEILSESSTSRDRGVKVQLYALRGAAYQRTATHGDDDHAHFDAPAGFAMNLADA